VSMGAKDRQRAYFREDPARNSTHLRIGRKESVWMKKGHSVTSFIAQIYLTT
jgi:hypothetical protein